MRCATFAVAAFFGGSTAQSPQCWAQLGKDCPDQNAGCALCITEHVTDLRAAGCNIKLGTHDDGYAWCHQTAPPGPAPVPPTPPSPPAPPGPAPSPVPAQMLAARKVASAACPAPKYACIRTETVAVPKPGRGAVLIRVNSSSVNPIDLDMLANPIGGGLGFDVAGVVVSVGAGVTRFKVDDRVWYMGACSAYAEYAVVPEAGTAVVPASLDLHTAGTVPMGALTSLYVFEKAGAPWPAGSNKTVVIVAGSGGTGYFAVQLAKIFGAARIVTSATGADTIQWVKSLGADVVTDYEVEEAIDSVPDDSVDVVYDNVGTNCGDAAMKKLRAGGSYVYIAPGSNKGKDPKPGVKQILYALGAQPAPVIRAGLEKLAPMFDAKQLRAFVQKEFPLTEVPEAFAYKPRVSKIMVAPAH